MIERGPDWYLKATDDLLLQRDTQDARAVLDEARAKIRSGQSPKAVATALRLKGARKNAPAVVKQALAIELPEIMKDASNDLAAGRTDGIALAQARVVAKNLPAEGPNWIDLVEAQLGLAGASDLLAEHLMLEIALEKNRRQAMWQIFGLGAAAALASALFYVTTPSGMVPFGSGVLIVVAALALWRGVRIRIRR